MKNEITLSELANKLDDLSNKLENFHLPEQTNQGKIGLSITEAAELVDVSPGTMRTWIKADYVPYTQIRGCVKISRKALEEWIYKLSINRARLDIC